MIWIIGGTSEGKEFYQRLNTKIEDKVLKENIVVTSATDSYKEFLDANILSKRMDKDEMKDFIIENKIDLLIDMSHPFADIVTKNAREATDETKIKYIRFEREDMYEKNNESKNNHINIYFENYEELIVYLDEKKKENKTFLFTTGSKGVGDFMNVIGNNRFIFRVLPDEGSLKILKDSFVKMKDIIAMLGPFSYDMNYLMLKENKVDYLVTKESGNNGGFDEKIKASNDLNIPSLIIKRPKKLDSLTMDEIETLILKKIEDLK